MPAHIQNIFAGCLLCARLHHSHLKGPLSADGRVHRHVHSALSTAQREGGNVVTEVLLTLDGHKHDLGALWKMQVVIPWVWSRT